MPAGFDEKQKALNASSQASLSPLANRFCWWLTFAAATQMLAMFFSAFRDFTLFPSMASLLQLLGVVLGVVLTLGLMVYDSYVKEREKGNIHKPFRVFESVYQWQFNRRANPDKKQGRHSS